MALSKIQEYQLYQQLLIFNFQENMEIFDFELETTEMEKIEDLNQNFSFDKNNNKINDCSEFIYI